MHVKHASDGDQVGVPQIPAGGPQTLAGAPQTLVGETLPRKSPGSFFTAWPTHTLVGVLAVMGVVAAVVAKSRGRTGYVAPQAQAMV